jgi:hypothetical protein
MHDAARTVVELEAEIAELADLEQLARRVVASGVDRKWEELAKLLGNTPEMLDASGRVQKLIIFTEHRDTLEYLPSRLGRIARTKRRGGRDLWPGFAARSAATCRTGLPSTPTSAFSSPPTPLASSRTVEGPMVRQSPSKYLQRCFPR